MRGSHFHATLYYHITKLNNGSNLKIANTQSILESYNTLRFH